MEAPKCKVCQKRHYGSCAGLSRPSKKTLQKQMNAVQGLVNKHRNGDDLETEEQADHSQKAPETEKAEEARKDAGDIPAENCPTCGQVVRVKTDRTEYMKNYMREYRRKNK